MLSPGFVEIAQELGISVSQLAKATSWMILTIGLSLFVLNPYAKIYGRRPIYIFSIVIMFISSVIGGAAKNFHNFQASRVIGGFGMAPFEILVQCTIGDLYFVHERATRIAFWNLCLLCGVNAGALIAGYIIQNLGWKWCFWICAILYGVLTVLIIFFVPETCYNRANGVAIQSTAGAIRDDEAKGDDIHETEVVHLGAQYNSMRGPAHSEEASDVKLRATSSFNRCIPLKMSYWRSLRVFSGRYSNAPILRVAVRPFIIFWYPGVFVLFIV
jgi:multidrug resistance protein